MDAYKRMDTTQAAIAAALIFIIGGALGFYLGRAAGPGGGTPEIRREAETPVAAADTALLPTNALIVPDQAPGLTVSVASVSLDRAGWVVVREDRDGAPGNILGARRFDHGRNQTGSVDLLRATEQGRVYYAVLHADDGDRAFDYTRDRAITGPQGNAVLVRFVASTFPVGE